MAPVAKGDSAAATERVGRRVVARPILVGGPEQAAPGPHT